MGFDPKNFRPLPEPQPKMRVVPIPVDPLKHQSDLADLINKYLQAQMARQALEKGNKPPPTSAQVSEGQAAITYGREVGKYRAAAQQNLPGAVSAAKATTAHLKKLLAHPGFSAVVGTPEPWKGGFGVYNIPGTRAKGAETLLKQIQRTAFLTGVQSLKGTGPVSEREGKAAEEAVARMSKALSEDEFRQAAQEYVDSMERGIAAMRQTAMMPINTPVVVPSSGEKE